jgi:uncharacterized repeat protein (TIGR01451 family)
MKNISQKISLLLMILTLFGMSVKAQCVAGFTSNANLVNGQYGSGLVSFTDTSHASVGDTIISWAWDFGDGVTANIKNPVHFFPTAGIYTISLTVQDNSSSNGTQQQVLMNVPYPQGCQAYVNFNYPQPYPTVPGPPVPISFKSDANLIPTNDAIASVLWNFGDGNTSTLLNPVYTYAQDTAFNVSYTITTVNGCTSNHSIIVNSAPCTMTSIVEVSPTDSTIFNLQITNGIAPYTINWQQSTVMGVWDTVPSSQITNNNLTLQAYDSTVYVTYPIIAANGCLIGGYSPFSLNGFTFDYTVPESIVANFVFLQQNSNGLNVDFSDNSHYGYSWSTPINIVSQFWDFGDGFTSTSFTPTHLYANYGSYTITHTITDANGLSGTCTININIIHCNYQFIGSIAPPVGNNNILTATSTGGFGALTYLWQDSVTTTQSIDASLPGYYSVSISDDNGCIASISQWIQQNPTLQYNPHFQDTCNANFIYGLGTSSAVVGPIVSFQAEEMFWGHLNNPHTYTWTFNDGYVDTLNVGIGNSPFYYRPYSTGQVIVATLTVTSATCSATQTQTVNFSPNVCNLGGTWDFMTNMGLFQNQYPLKISAQPISGAGTFNSCTYLWDNGSTSRSIYAYNSGTYCCTITDSIGCTKYICYTYYAPYDSTITICGNVFNDANNNGIYDGPETALVSSNVITITGNGNTYLATVDGLGNYAANVPAGVYDISYSVQQGHNFTTPSSSDTIAHYLSVDASYGANLCGYDFGVSNNTSTIGGKLFYDENSNGVLDNSEVGIAYQPIFAGPYTVFTDANGDYSMNVIANTYNLTYTPQNAFSSYTLTTPGTININATTVGSFFPNKNFGIHTTNIGCDLGVNLWPTSVVNNGFPAHYTIEYFNNGVTSVNNTITMVYDTTRTFNNASIPPTSINTTSHTITWNIPILEAYTNHYLYINFTANVALSMNTPVTTTAQISNPTGTETALANNTAILHQLSVASWDPNDKMAIKTNNDNPTQQIISTSNADQEIEYMIRFQNIGNASAVNVRIVDELSSLVDENSFVLLGGSHNCQVTRLGKTVTYKFDNIMLPTEDAAGDASNGFVTYKIKAINSLVVGDLISDMAKIYFDFNQPILTNYANVLMVDPSVISDSQSIVLTNNNLGIFPNPISSIGYIKYALEEDAQIELRLNDIKGTNVFTTNINAKKGMNYYDLDASQFHSGLYTLQLKSPQGNSFYKVNIVNQ